MLLLWLFGYMCFLGCGNAKFSKLEQRGKTPSPMDHNRIWLLLDVCIPFNSMFSLCDHFLGALYFQQCITF